ncbi:hypothetical protein [Streptomyces sp. cg36]|uniref:hypothetical protein n=1 Tax=Streptomyces sp. cg36 TaxID=3238798 RepID=UPI0034E1A308
MRTAGVDTWTGLLRESLLRSAVRRVLAGATARPRWIPRRVLSVSADVDAAEGVGALRFVWRPRSRRGREHFELMRRYGRRWRSVGGGGGPVGDPVDVEVLDVRSGCGVRTFPHDHTPPLPNSLTLWIGCLEVHVGPDVDHVLVGTRRIPVPEGRALVAVWTSSHPGRPLRPLVVAVGRDGTELSRMGPLDGLDTHTRARLAREL